MCQGDSSWPCNNQSYHFCPYWSCVSWATWHGATHLALLQKGTTTPNCSQGTCNPVNFSVLKPSDWTQGQIISIRIDGQGFDPRTLLHLKLTTVTHESSPYQVFHSFYEEMPDKFPISVTTKNLLIYSPDIKCHFVLCVRGSQHGRPLALGGKGVRPMTAF
jgi:hypothetical protein